MTRKDSVRHAAATAKESVLHAAEVAAPYAGTAKENATHYAAHYADEARSRLAPKVASAADQARETARTQYGAHLAPYVAQAKDSVPPKVTAAAAAAAKRTRQAAHQAAEYAGPRIEHAAAAARAATDPVREEAAARGAATLAVLRGQISPAEIERLIRRHNRRARAGRVAKRLLVVGALAGAGFAAWRWWSRQTNPEWLVEEPSATETADDSRGTVTGRPTLSAVDGSGDALDPDVQAEAEAAERRKHHEGGQD